jgi:hypothetical protein
MPTMSLYMTTWAAMLIHAVAVGTLGFVTNRILPGCASFLRGLLLTLVLVVAAKLSQFVGVVGMSEHRRIWATQAIVALIETVIGTACGYLLVRSVFKPSTARRGFPVIPMPHHESPPSATLSSR